MSSTDMSRTHPQRRTTRTHALNLLSAEPIGAAAIEAHHCFR